MKIEYTIATKGIHGGYSTIKRKFGTELEARKYSLKFKEPKIVKITWLNDITCKEEYI